jgi:hypothetical protein
MLMEPVEGQQYIGTPAKEQVEIEGGDLSAQHVK